VRSIDGFLLVIRDDGSTTLIAILDVFLAVVMPRMTYVVFLHMRYERYSIYYYNDECSIYREHKVTIHERMRPLNNQ
jgi:hypothetical protein